MYVASALLHWKRCGLVAASTLRGDWNRSTWDKQRLRVLCLVCSGTLKESQHVELCVHVGPGKLWTSQFATPSSSGCDALFQLRAERALPGGSFYMPKIHLPLTLISRKKTCLLFSWKDSNCKMRLTSHPRFTTGSFHKITQCHSINVILIPKTWYWWTAKYTCTKISQAQCHSTKNDIECY